MAIKSKIIASAFNPQITTRCEPDAFASVRLLSIFKFKIMETLPIPRTTIIALVSAFNEAEAKITQGFKTLQKAEAGLIEAFGDKWHQFDLAYLVRQHRLDFKDPGPLLDYLK